ncbi:MAG TPA: CoB--CoM heterodisulfide reductase iron-sulfur subunit B family protein [Candidatus Sulfomarinibacteraceae bacterium]|nr:CoB--CoM heterodisulfide reductase iron-sulfur subunit B family protein [Candidatus Sulfomarinibacteraceae bacterium]
MKLGYYPGCTLKTKAANLEQAAMAALDRLGIEFTELSRWNCCGAVFSLADDDLIHQVAPVRNLIRAAQQGCDTVVTICSQCYNTLARANKLVREDEEKRDTLNRFMREEPDYNGEVEVVHYLSLLRDRVGWEKLREAVTNPLTGLKVAPFYGCTLVRPEDVAIDAVDDAILEGFIRALGAEPASFTAARECCGSYQMLAHPEEGMKRAAKVIAAANRSAADALILSCPLCEYNLGTRQRDVVAAHGGLEQVPTFYFTQLLGVALGLDVELCRLDLNGPAARTLLTEKKYIAAATA